MEPINEHHQHRPGADVFHLFAVPPD